MFCLRIHSLDSPLHPPPTPPPSSEAQETSTSSCSSSAAATTTTTAASKESFGIESIRGTIHLYRTVPPPPPHSFSDSIFLAVRGTLLFVPAVPSHLSADEFMHFYGSYTDRASGIRIVRNDAWEDRYNVLVKFDDQKNADAFYLNLNGWRFSSAEGEVCHILFLGSVEFTDLMEIADTPPAGSTELPTCPVCLGEILFFLIVSFNK